MHVTRSGDVSNRLYLFFWENGDAGGGKKCLQVAYSFDIGTAILLRDREVIELN
jgi:hypothetical protein